MELEQSFIQPTSEFTINDKKGGHVNLPRKSAWEISANWAIKVVHKPKGVPENAYEERSIKETQVNADRWWRVEWIGWRDRAREGRWVEGKFFGHQLFQELSRKEQAKNGFEQDSRWEGGEEWKQWD